MKKWQHGLYISAIVILAFTTWLGARGLFTSSEKLLDPPSKDFEASTPEMGLVTFDGAWKSDNPFEPMDMTHYKYTCTKRDMTCQIAWVPVKDNVLLIETSSDQITSWDDKQIVMTDQDECRPSTIVVDLVTEQVTQIEQDAPNPRNAICTAGWKDAKKSILVNGIDEAYNHTKGN